MSNQTHAEGHQDKIVADSFPASDPPAQSGVAGAGTPDQAPHERSIEERPTGTPTSDRHATETAHQRENETTPPAES
jgi:hypothetical protein